jgi:HK97 family phage major capsid protein
MRNSYQDLKKDRAEALAKAEVLVSKGANITADEQKLVDVHLAEVESYNVQLQKIEADNTILGMLNTHTGAFLHGGESAPRQGDHRALTTTEGTFRATQFRTQFAGWMNRTLDAVGGLSPKMEASAPSGPVSIGSADGADSIGVTVPTEVLPYMPAYYNLDSFALAGASQIFTPHTRPLVKPIISAGAADSVFAENTAPSTSQPFGLSSFTFNGTKYSRLVLASYEALMNSELPLQGVILDELLASIATTFTTALTTAMYTALSGATAPVGGGNPLLVGTDSDDVYSSMTGLRNAIPPRFDLPTNKWMLSRASLAVIRNARASTSGVPMFDPNSNLIFGREFVINDNFDSICGPGFVAFGDWADGMWIRKTPLFTRVFLELYAQSGQVGYRTTQYLDQHFLAELTATAQPPTFQPLYYTVLASAGTS